MVDQNYSEFLLELGSNAMDTLVKQEPIQGLEINSSSSSASVPIPGGHRGTHGVFDQFSPSPLAINSIWNTKTDQDDSQFRIDAEQLGISFKMEDDDIFQVDKADLIQGPTLAELNANDDILLGDLNFDDLLLPEDNRIIQTQRNQQQQQQQIINDNSGGPMFSNNGLNFTPNRFPQTSTSYKNFQSYNINSGLILNPGLTIIDNNSMEPVSPPGYPSPGTSNIAGSSTPSSSTSPHPIVRPTGQSTLHELLMRKGDVQPTSPMINHMDITQNEPSVSNPKVSRLSMSAPTQSMGLEQIWARREPRQHLLSTGSLAAVEIGSTSSISTGGALSPDPLGTTDGIGQLSHDEGYEDSDDDSDHYDDFSSENDSGGSDVEDQGIRGSNDNTRESKLSKKEKYFWQYNVQAKGPKGQRLVARVRLEDPHVLNEATDPVFSPHCALRGIKHSGKARKGDGNDLTPNPRKLHSIGRELDKLSRVINDMTPVSELPFTARPKTRKEKNKLASRACRLKKKAQHEANKIKLHGLEQEHKRLIHGIAQMKATLSAKASESNEEKQEELTKQMDRICKVATKVRIANHSTDFVNKVLDKVKAGVPDGGIDEF